MDSSKSQSISPDADYSTIIVTTADVVRYSFLLELQVNNFVPVLLVRRTSLKEVVEV